MNQKTQLQQDLLRSEEERLQVCHWCLLSIFCVFFLSAVDETRGGELSEWTCRYRRRLLTCESNTRRMHRAQRAKSLN